MKIKSDIDSERIDKYIKENSEFSRETVLKMIKDNKVYVNGNNNIKPSYKVQIDDEIEFDESYLVQSEQNLTPEEVDFDILYEDNDLMVINKPSGLVVHPGNGNHDHTLVNGLLYYQKNLSDIGDDLRPGIVHRIDKDTSGIMLVAKNNKAHELLADAFKNKTIKRTYLALLIGNFPHDSATIDAPIGRDSKNRLKMCVTANNSKNAITHLKVVKRYKKYTLVSLNLETGRTHQIRVHMEYIGYPIYNDPIYSKCNATEFGQFLHSSEVDFTHPITGEKLHFKVDLPEEFKSFIDNLEEKES